jgi:hypothetical protein
LVRKVFRTTITKTIPVGATSLKTTSAGGIRTANMAPTQVVNTISGSNGPVERITARIREKAATSFTRGSIRLRLFSLQAKMSENSLDI